METKFGGDGISYEVKALSEIYKTGQTTQYSSELDDGYYQKGVAKSYSILTTGQFADTVNIDLTHLVSDTGAFTLANQTYTDAGKCGVFLAAGGDVIVITGSASNNGTFTTASATADTVVVTAGFVNEADAPSTTFKKREAHSNACILDLNSRKGLMWSQTVSDKMGTASDGKMPWTGQTYDIFAYCAAANTALLGGYGDWRVPTKMEMESLVNAQNTNGEPDTTAFAGFPVTSYVISSTTTKTITARAYYFDFSTSGSGAMVTKTTSGLILLVRGG